MLEPKRGNEIGEEVKEHEAPGSDSKICTKVGLERPDTGCVGKVTGSNPAPPTRSAIYNFKLLIF